MNGGREEYAHRGLRDPPSKASMLRVQLAAQHTAFFHHARIECGEDVRLDRRLNLVGVTVLDATDNGASFVVVSNVGTLRFVAEHIAEQIGFRANDVTKTLIRDDADVAIFDVLLLRRRIRQLRLERRVVDHDVDTERIEVIARIDTTHVKEPFAEFVVAFEQVPRVGVHNERTHHFTIVLDVELVDEVVDVCQSVARGVGEIGGTLHDVVRFPFVVNVEIGFDHCERAVVHAIAELEFGILEQLSAEKLGVGGDTVHQLEIFAIFLIQDGETFGRSTIILNIAGYFANLAIVEDDAFAELGDLIFLNRQFSRPTDCRFAVGVANVQDDVRVFVTLDGFDFVLNRAFVREKGRQGFGEIGCANTRPNREKIRRIPILGNEHCHDICLLLSSFRHDDHVRRERRFLDATRIQNDADTRTRIDEHVARNGERDTVRCAIDRRANER